jgi:hypothetical protein
MKGFSLRSLFVCYDMNMNDSKKNWMKRRRYGWGWIPTTWQGWLFVVLQIGVLFFAALQLPPKPAQPSEGQLVKLFIIVGLVVTSLALVSSRTAPKPHWRWGKKDTDNPNEDF